MNAPLQPEALSPEEPVAVLVVSSSPDDATSLRRILNHPNWRLYPIGSYREAMEFLGASEVAVALCSNDQPDGRWLHLLNPSEKLAARPEVVVFSRLADEYLWAEVLNLGGWDLLNKPFADHEVRRVTFAAWQSWKRRTELRKPARRHKYQRASNAA